MSHHHIATARTSFIGDPRPHTLGGRTDPTSSWVRHLAARQRRRFDGRGMRIGRRDTVHAVRYRPWIGDEEIPAPACRVGTDVPDLSDALLPVTDQAVTCRRCLAYEAAHRDAQPYRPQLAQIGLWGDADEAALPAYPPAS